VTVMIVETFRHQSEHQPVFRVRKSGSSQPRGDQDFQITILNELAAHQTRLRAGFGAADAK